MSTELTISVKGEDSSFKQKFLIYEEFKWSEDDTLIRKCVSEALSNSQIMPETITVRGLLILK